MDYQKTASEILKHIGGEKNVVSLEHCSTRLRFILADRSKADADAVKRYLESWVWRIRCSSRLLSETA